MTKARNVFKMRPGLSSDEALKPSELIRVSGHQTLSLYERRAITLLWHNAHTQGLAENKDYTIALSDLRVGQNRSVAVIENAVEQLMKTILTVTLPDGRIRRVQFLGGNDMQDPDRTSGLLTYSFDRRLVEVLKQSEIFGKIALPVLTAISSKYGLSIYENIAQLVNLKNKTFEEWSLEEFREMIGIEDGKYPKFGALNRHVLKPAELEVNALAHFNIRIVPRKQGKRVTRIQVHWWHKDADELKEAYAENNRPKVGRRARIEGRVEQLSLPEALPAAETDRVIEN